MELEDFLQRMVELVGIIKMPVVVIMSGIVILRVIGNMAIGGPDTRGNFILLLKLLATAIMLFMIERILEALRAFFGGQ